MTQKEIKEVLEKHKRWLEESEGWSEEDRADLRGGFYKWENHEPGISKVKAAAEYLGVSVDSLTSEQEVEDGKLSED